MTDWSENKKATWGSSASKSVFPAENKAWPGQAPDGSIGNSLSALVKPERKKKGGLGPAREAKAIGWGESVGKAAATGAGVGIASPLTEKTKTILVSGTPKTVPDRDYFAERTLTSSDGLFTFKIKDFKTTRFVDAAGNDEVRNWADPKDEA